MYATNRYVVLPTPERKESSWEQAEKARPSAGELLWRATAARLEARMQRSEIRGPRCAPGLCGALRGLVSVAGCTIPRSVPHPSTETFL